MTVLNPGQMPRPGHALESRVRTWMVRLILAALLAVVTLIAGGGVQAVLNVPDLQPWHRLVPEAEVRAADLDDSFTLQQYLAREAAVFDQVRDQVESPVSRSGSQAEANRYQSASISSPRRASRDWNRTFELTPTGALRGGALLIHGLTDSPYSMRSIATTLQAQGYYALALRVPGHGTVPGALTQATAEDWMAAVRMGARHVRQTIGADRPMILVGYSNGGALVMRYALEATADARLPSPARVVLISPMIGVSPLARMARVISALGPLPFFEKARWLDVIPEYNPFKYNSFPANAANQSYRVSSLLRTEVADASRSGLLDRLPPILAFQSVVDATVSTPAVVDLFDRLHGNGHELVIFDINRRAGLEPYLRPTDAALVRSLAAPRRTPLPAHAHHQRQRRRVGGPRPFNRGGCNHHRGRATGALLADADVFALARRLAVRRRRSRLWQRAARSGDSLDRAGTPEPQRREGGAYGAGGNLDANRMESLPAVPPRPSRRVDRSRCRQC